MYPLISEYIEAIKAAEDNFDQLKHLRPVLDDDGLPVMTSGNFAVVFKMKDEQTDKLYAVKCFTKEQEGRAEAYLLIAEELKDVDSPYLVSLHYLDKELFVDTEQTNETEFPVLLMDWVEGKTLDKYLRENLDDKYALEMLAYRFSQLAQWLMPQPFAHGDLKPDNILVREDGTLVLVDYDGMYVPAMKGQKARELGSPDFRHPLRTADDFDEHIDDFPLVTILLSLKAISYKPQLYGEYGAADRLLFSYNDFQDINKCDFLKDTFPSGNRFVDELACLFSAVYYYKRLPANLYSYVFLFKPLLLIPYTIGKGYYSLYNRIDKEILPLQYEYVEFVDRTLEKSSSCIISNEYGDWICGYKNAAIISHPRDINNIHWYQKILKIGNLRDRFIANRHNRYGIINDHNQILLDFDYQKINYVENGEDIYYICRKHDNYGLLDKHFKIIIPFNKTEMYYKSKLIYYGYNQDCYVMDLYSCKEYKLPIGYNRIEDYHKGVFVFEIGERKYRFYDIERQGYLNDYIYQESAQDKGLIFKDSFALCKREHTYILLSLSGEEFPIDFNGILTQYGDTVVGIVPIETKNICSNGIVHTKYDYEISVFKKNVLQSKFTHKSSILSKATFELINENTLKVCYNTKYGMTWSTIKIKDDPVAQSPENQIQMATDNSVERTWLSELVKNKYINSTYINGYNELTFDQLNYFEIKEYGGIAYVCYHWDNGSCDIEDHYECDIRIGYADESMCYW